MFEIPSDTSVYKQLVSSIKPFPEKNILILGETGVGKSTWINAFYNYMMFETLEEAEQNDELLSLIPSQFTVCDDSYNEVTVCTGNDRNEKSGGGQSATQECRIYNFRHERNQINLIDTPGIGDTRGVEQDRKNFGNILETISNLDELHGVCILLKPNEARITINFRWCIQELLTYLHRDCSRNILFCFTNSRGTLFRPGETMKSLRKILENKAVDIPISKSTVYCFDSEAFRFLAAVKSQKVIFSEKEKESFVASWNQSREETDRLLREIKQLKPHSVSGTISLNTARDTIHKLTGPLAKTADNVRTNTKSLEDYQKAIIATRSNIDELLKKKMLKIRTLKVVPINYPKTVCTNVKCKKILKINKNESKINYVTECHTPCTLKGIQHDVIGHEGLLQCACIHPTGEMQTCTNCRHSYKEHMHIVYDSEEVDAEVEDENILLLIDQKISEKEVKEHLLKNTEKKIDEMNSELKIIQDASVKFACFLKLSAITPYNDAMVDYMNQLIREEKEMINAQTGRGEARLCSLVEDLKSYKAKVEILMKNIDEGDKTSAAAELPDIEHLFEDLRNLKHSGKFIRDALETNNRSQSFVTSATIKYVESKHSWLDWTKKKIKAIW
jgi:GTPase SAR1 family protein